MARISMMMMEIDVAQGRAEYGDSLEISRFVESKNMMLL